MRTPPCLPTAAPRAPPNFHTPSSFIDRTMRMHYIYIPSDRNPVPQALRTPLHPLSTTMRTSSHRFGWTASGMNNKIKQDQVKETLWPCKKRVPELHGVILHWKYPRSLKARE